MEVIMVSGIQTVGILFSLILSYFTFLNYKRGQFTIREMIGWEVVWIGFALVTLYPNMFTVFSGNLGAARVFDLFSILGFVVVLSISFYSYTSLDHLRKKFESSLRDQSLNGIDRSNAATAPAKKKQ
jgi:hypothetical protein